MERILVSMEAPRVAWEALIRAFSLAERTGKGVSVLLVYPDQAQTHHLVKEEHPVPVREKLELIIRNLKPENISPAIYMTEGPYEEEVIRFVEEYGITHLIIEFFEENPKVDARSSKSINRIRHRVKCRMEVVHKK